MIYQSYIIICFGGLLSTLLILSSLNPISRLALLIVVFLMSAFQYMILDYYFLGLTYIIVYVGAIAVLFLFVIMLIQTNLKASTRTIIEPVRIMAEKSVLLELEKADGVELYRSINNPLRFGKESGKIEEGGSIIPQAMIMGIIMITGICGYEYYVGESNMMLYIESLVTGVESMGKEAAAAEGKSNSYNYIYTLWTKEIYTLTDIQTIGYSIYLGYPIGLIILGILLWIVLIGVLCISH